MDNTEVMKEKINYTLEKYGETHVKELAKKIGHSPATVSRYLGILYAEGKLTLTEKPPYKYYKLKENE